MGRTALLRLRVTTDGNFAGRFLVSIRMNRNTFSEFRLPGEEPKLQLLLFGVDGESNAGSVSGTLKIHK